MNVMRMQIDVIGPLIAGAEKGNAGNQFLIGMMYLNGEGVEQDTKEALKWLLKASKQGHAEAQLHLGLGYYNDGNCSSLEMKKAFDWVLKAAEQGQGDAQVCLGFMYDEGLAVAKDEDKSIDWLIKAGENRHPKAIEILEDLAEQGYTRAQTFLGR
jgi:uncharacterized protein